MKKPLDAALEIFTLARAYVDSEGLAHEVAWQGSRSTVDFTESDLLREAAWVILCSGFRESIVRSCFDYISLAFCDWESAAAIVTARGACHRAAMASIANRRKLDAIVKVAEIIHDVTFRQLKQRILQEPIAELQQFPFIGPITSWHLAKNLGFDVAKNDRHLARLSEWLGYADAMDLCRAIAAVSGESLNVIDLILWRYIVGGGWKTAAILV